MIRLAVRHLPPDATVDSVANFLEQIGFAKSDGIIVQRIFKGKVGTSTKSECPSTAYILTPNEVVAAKICKKLLQKDQPIRCELAYIQKTPERAFGSKQDPQAGTWQSDPEYLRFQASLQIQQQPTPPIQHHQPSYTDEQNPTVVVPLVAHMRKEIQQRRNKAIKTKKDRRKRKAPNKKPGEKPQTTAESKPE